MIESFDEVMGDAQAVEDAKVWLLKQKQTQWQTTRAWKLSKRVIFPKGSVRQWQNEFKDLAVLRAR